MRYFLFGSQNWGLGTLRYEQNVNILRKILPNIFMNNGLLTVFEVFPGKGSPKMQSAARRAAEHRYNCLQIDYLDLASVNAVS